MNVVKYFVGLGGSTLRDAIGWCIKRSFEGEFIREVTWTGSGQTDKFRLEGTNFTKCLRGAMRRSQRKGQIPDFTEQMFYENIMAALKSEKQILRNRARQHPQEGQNDDGRQQIPSKRGRLSKAQRAAVDQGAWNYDI
ncbi:uncharacterized protein LOC107043744 [Diachasma alloeum]|uniref:uncharacterized protein LOC107043744 n=1 Tax=Diachasma alloeum TaxID=454923 RepID=UPI00073836AF|nr:uncharacterized protein LOC107043744 [Diachasma alloeum]